MTIAEAKKLEAKDWVWAYCIDYLHEVQDMTPTRCYVSQKPDGVMVRLMRISSYGSLDVPASNVFLTKEEAKDAMRKELKTRIGSLKRENTRLMYPIREQLIENEKQIIRLSSLLNTIG
jgi:hypothetical protein